MRARVISTKREANLKARCTISSIMQPTVDFLHRASFFRFYFSLERKISPFAASQKLADVTFQLSKMIHPVSVYSS